MIWTRSIKVSPSAGDLRIKHKFAWLPTEVQSLYTDKNVIVVVWLEYYSITEKFTAERFVSELGVFGYTPSYWKVISKNSLSSTRNL